MSSHDISPADARARALQGALLVDIRQLHERASGQAEGALAIAQNSWKRSLQSICPSKPAQSY